MRIVSYTRWPPVERAAYGATSEHSFVFLTPGTPNPGADCSPGLVAGRRGRHPSAATPHVALTHQSPEANSAQQRREPRVRAQIVHEGPCLRSEERRVGKECR